MVARISFPLDLRKVIHYHEGKVRANVAQILNSVNFLKDTRDLSVADKIFRFERLHTLNKRVDRPTFHGFLRFDPSETLDNQLLVRIADEYMTRIGYSDQPYLVYRHMDAPHPHIHILSTLIRPDGSRMSTHNIGKLRSAPARKAIERLFGLLTEEQRKQNKKTGLKVKQQPKDINASSRIEAIVEYVVSNYSFISLLELNAILKVYNIRAYTGKPGGSIEKNKGLIYHRVNDQGRAVGGCVKSSRVPGKPTLAFIEQHALQNSHEVSQHTPNLTRRIDKACSKKPATWKELVRRLKGQKVDILPLMNDRGHLYDVVFIDRHTRLVAAGSRLGTDYEPESIFRGIDLSGPVSTMARKPVDYSKPFVPDPRTVSQDMCRAFEALGQSPPLQTAEKVASHNHKKRLN